LSSENYDVVIVGGGPAGASAGIHLAARGARVLLAEREHFPRPKLCGEFISPECLTHFARLGVAERMTAAGGAAVGETVFYTRSGRGAAVPSAWLGHGAQQRALGLSRAEMDARLLARAREAGVAVLEGAQAVGLATEDGGRVCGVRLSVEGETVERRAALTVDATGRAHALVRFVEKGSVGGVAAARRGRAPHVAFKAHLEGARGHEGACEIYFYRGGYGGLSPVEGDLSNLCFIARAADVRDCGSDPRRVMREVLMKNRRAARTLDGARPASAWLSVALEGFGRREPAPARGLLAVGDAASFIDPFTGSGMLMALESGELAAEAIARRLAPGDRGAGRADAFDELAGDYRARYEERFGARLRLCGWLRRAAFAPRAFAEAAVFALGASAPARRRLARATRGT
jgi:flavin-dependent dehydrogenase